VCKISGKLRRHTVCAKEVHFADECGKPLYKVRVMTEPSDVPPKFSAQLLSVLLGAEFEKPKLVSNWKLNFMQPACDMVKLRATVKQQNVSLENAVVNNETSKLFGTVLVTSMALESQVFIRHTFNNWLTQADIPCVCKTGNPNDIFETYLFELDIPYDEQKNKQFEFCVCYRVGTTKDTQVEYWDSNNSANYVVSCAN